MGRTDEDVKFYKAELLKYVSWYWERYGFAPSYRSIAKAIGVQSTSTIFGYINSLERNGRIVRNPVNNQIRVVNNGKQEGCAHDWRVRKITNPLKLICADCEFVTEVEYNPTEDTNLKDLLKYTGKV